MKRVTILLFALLLGVANAAHAEESSPESRAFVEIRADHDAYYVGQPITVTLRVGFDRDWFAARATPLFRQEMDVPVQVMATELREPPKPLAALDVPREAAPTRERTFVLGDEVVEARIVEDEERNGRRFEVLEIVRRFRPESAGEVTFAKPTLRFRYATRFEEDFVGGRIALDPKDVRTEGQPLSFTVQPLPAEGRPAEFVDAVGRFRVGAELKAEDDKLHVVLTIEGEGNLQALSPPTGRAFPGFHVYGRIDDRKSPRRTITYDVAPLNEAVYEVPPIPLAFFDPGPPARYEIAHTAPLPLPGREPPSIDEATDDAEGLSGATAIVILIATALGAILLAVFLAAGFHRMRRQSAAEPEPELDERLRRIETAAAALKKALAEEGADLVDPFTAYLASHLECPTSAVIDPELPGRLAAAGLTEELAAETAATLEKMVATRYGGLHAGGRTTGFPELVDTLESAFRRGTGRDAAS